MELALYQVLPAQLLQLPLPLLLRPHTSLRSSHRSSHQIFPLLLLLPLLNQHVDACQEALGQEPSALGSRPLGRQLGITHSATFHHLDVRAQRVAHG